MAENYPTWDQIEKKLRQFWQDSYPREKIVELKQTKSELEFGTEIVGNSVVEYQHVYYYGNVTVTKPDGGKYLYPMRIAYYQVPGQPQWNFNYATPFGDHKVLEKGAGEDPLKLTPEKALDIVKKYVEIMMQKYFPPAKWKDYCAANSVEVKVNKVGFKDQPDQVQRNIDDINSKIQLDPSQSFRTSITIDGQYKDNAGSFKFRLQNLFPDLYVNLDQAFWTLSRDKTPVDQLTPADFSGLKDKLLETSEEPRKALEQWIPEASPLEKALALMMDPDANKRCEGIDELKWIQGFADDEEIIDDLSKLLMDNDNTVVNYAKFAMENAEKQATKSSTKDKIKAALEARAKADVAGVAAAKAGAEAEKEAQYKKWIEELSDINKASGALNFLRTRWAQRILTDDSAMNAIITAWIVGKLTDARMYLDQVRSYDKDKVSPEILAKINETLGAVQTGPKDKATAPVASAPAQQVDEYAQAVADLKDKSNAMYSIRKLKASKHLDKLLVDESAMSTLIDIWLKKDAYDSSTRNEARSFMDTARSTYKDKVNAAMLQKIEDALKNVRY